MEKNKPSESDRIVSFSCPPDFCGIAAEDLKIMQREGMNPRYWNFPDKAVYGYGITADGTIWGRRRPKEDVYFTPTKTPDNGK